MTAVDGEGLTSTLPEMLIAISCMHEMPIPEPAMPSVLLTLSSSPIVCVEPPSTCFLLCVVVVAVCFSARLLLSPSPCTTGEFISRELSASDLFSDTINCTCTRIRSLYSTLHWF